MAQSKLVGRVVDVDGDLWSFKRRGSTLYMVGPAGTGERITSYRDGIWRMGESSERSMPIGDRHFVGAWTRGIGAVFPGMPTGPFDIEQYATVAVLAEPGLIPEDYMEFQAWLDWTGRDGSFVGDGASIPGTRDLYDAAVRI